MTILGKKQMSEEDIKLNFITPVIQRGWKGHITMETRITDGRINIRGNIVARSKPKFADYLLYLNDGKPIAVVEAKDNSHSVSHGLQQAMTYAQMMDLPFAYSSNGDAFYEHDFLTGQEQQIELEKFPTQNELIARYYAEHVSAKILSAKCCEQNGGSNRKRTAEITACYGYRNRQDIYSFSDCLSTAPF